MSFLLYVQPRHILLRLVVKTVTDRGGIYYLVGEYSVSIFGL